jgi:hypothetical protein
VDQLDRALRAYRTAQAGVPRAEQRARELVAAARAKAERARAELAAAIVAEHEAGARQVDLIKRTGYSRERVRQILREAGVEVPEVPGG